MSAMRFRYRRGSNGFGGYRGKERLNRDRSRASRCQARQLIEEYMEADDDGGDRHLRIGHRSEFLPSVGVTDAEVVSRDEQLNLPLDARRRALDPEDAQTPAPEPKIRLHRPEPAPVAPPEADAPSEAAAVDDRRGAPASAAERPRRAPYEWFVDRRAARAKRFQRGHFLYGCALGTAAAAVILAMLRVAFM